MMKASAEVPHESSSSDAEEEKEMMKASVPPQVPASVMVPQQPPVASQDRVELPIGDEASLLLPSIKAPTVDQSRGIEIAATEDGTLFQLLSTAASASMFPSQIAVAPEPSRR
jgi:hypothetical protein